MAALKTPEVIRNIVTTCLNHLAAWGHPEHFIRSENDGAIYENNIND